MNGHPSTPHGKNLRTGRVSLPHQIYFITIATLSRASLFTRYETASLAAKGFYDQNLAPHAETLAYVVMPNHIHWLMQLKEHGDLHEAVRIYKAKVSLLLGKKAWQPGYHDHALRSEENLLSVARYLVANPLRAGLCAKIGDYPYWNAKWL
jgi:REP element-mobilizing transposase RayT